jgi:hypothetical protein
MNRRRSRARLPPVRLILQMQVSNSRSALACRMWSCSPRVRAAACASFVVDAVSAGLAGLTSKATIVAEGINSCINSRRFAASSSPSEVMPVILPPGLFRLSTSPSATGSPAVKMTIGIVVVAAFAASCHRNGNYAHSTMNKVARADNRSF